ncbi:hypothetical protein LSAT2_027330 [Lamellibrachia satsuma]|nr:hypothetical protein LSAT2_027330 [Lamellibrachia satsuma]
MNQKGLYNVPPTPLTNHLLLWKPCCLSVTGADIIQAPPPRVATFSELVESCSGSALTSDVECNMNESG